MSPARILALTVAAALAAAALIHQLRPQTPPVKASEDSWLPMPSMDAGSRAARMMLWQAFDPPGGNRYDSVAFNCGSDDVAAEEYWALIGDAWTAPDRRVWQVKVSVHGRRADVVIRDGSALDSPPPLPSDAPLKAFAPATRYVLDRSELEGVQQAWSDPALWLSPQAERHCRDGAPLVLEACVHGRYGARNRACDANARAAGWLLWQRLREKFPDPPPVRWQ